MKEGIYIKNKKILRKFSILALLTVFTSVGIQSIDVSSKTINNNELYENLNMEKAIPTSDLENYLPNLDSNFSVTEGENVIYFANQNDLDLYNSMKAGNNARYGEGMKVEVLDSTYKSHLWIGYHSGTSSWAKASSYTLTKGKTYSTSGSYSYKGYTVNTGFSYTNSVATTIPADSSRYSRLGTWGDFTFKYCKYIETSYGQPTGRVTYGVQKSMSNHYVQPTYQ